MIYGLEIPRDDYEVKNFLTRDLVEEAEVSNAGNVVLRVGRETTPYGGYHRIAYIILTPDEANRLANDINAAADHGRDNARSESLNRLRVEYEDLMRQGRTDAAHEVLDRRDALLISYVARKDTNPSMNVDLQAAVKALRALGIEAEAPDQSGYAEGFRDRKLLSIRGICVNESSDWVTIDLG